MTCCPEVLEKDWEYKTQVWKDRPFYWKSIRLFMHKPFGIKKAIEDSMKEIKEKGYKLKEPFLMLQHDDSAFSGRIYFALAERAKDDRVELLSGRFVTKYYKGPYQKIINAKYALEAFVEKKKSAKVVDWYMYWANCPKCQEKQGGPVSIIFAKVE